MRKLFFFILGLVTTSTFAQTANQAAVDTLTKEVAKAVFGKISQDPGQTKAQEIYDQLIDCGDGCDPQTVIRSVGGWDAVGVKMQELSELKNTAKFNAMSPAEANDAIRKQLIQFYSRYKSDNNYGKPLSPAVQLGIIQKIDALLPPSDESAEPTPTANPAPANEPADQVAEGDSVNVDPTLYRMSQLERQLKEKEESNLWMMIVTALGGLLLGGGAVYLLLYRSAQAEINALQDENNRLRNALENAQRARPGNDVNTVRSADRQKIAQYDAIVAELGGENPLTAIRQLKQQTVRKAENRPIMRTGEPLVEPTVSVPVEPEPMQVQTSLPPLPPLDPLPSLNRSEVFYFPPPDPSGQFDLSQKSSVLSPESAYRFSVNADNPTMATFRFEADPGRVARFMTYRNYMIEPACDSENSYSASHTRITMRRDGEATLENGVWRVKTKALIRYE
ncbi:hypothetical protein [Spirosoma aerolatum]|uniref:hypothetical protein n=1 Tax=Spirosoma aerolatum TaxID=1211326 RepID=UPI0009ABBEFC|nr:hypothetical protein [Spirosoma aerolatum]